MGSISDEAEEKLDEFLETLALLESVLFDALVLLESGVLSPTGDYGLTCELFIKNIINTLKYIKKLM